MADAEFTIIGRTQVDTSGMKDLADTAKDAKDAIDKITTTPDASPKVDTTGIVGIKDSAQEAKEAVDKLTTTPDAVPRVNTTEIRSVPEVVNEARDAIDEINAVEVAPKVDTSGLERVREVTGQVRQDLEEISAAMEAAMDGMDAPTQNAMRALEGLLSKYQEMEDKLKSGSFEFDFDGEGNVQSLKDVERAIEQVIDAQVMLSDQTSDMDFGGKWGDQVNEDVDKVLNAYNAEVEAAEAAAEKLVAAEEKAQKAAEASAGKVIAAYKRKQQQMGRSIDQLKADLEEYKRKMEEAAKAGDKIGQAEAIKGIESTSRQIKALTAEQNTNARASQTMAQNAGNIIRMMTTGQLSARGFSESVRGIGKALKTGLGPIGWAILLVEALCSSFSALIGWVKGWGAAAEDEAKRSREAFKKTVEEAKQAEEDLKKLREKMDNEKGIRGLVDYRLRMEEKISAEYDEQIRKIERQIRLKLYGLSDEADKTEHAYDVKAANLKTQAASEGWSRQKLNDALEANEISRKAALLIIHEEEATTKLNGAKDKQLELERKLAKQQTMLDEYKGNLGTEDPVTLKNKKESLELLIKEYDSLKKIAEMKDSGGLDRMTYLYDKWDGSEGSWNNALWNKQQTELADLLGFSDADEFGKNPHEVKRRYAAFMEKQSRLSELSGMTDKLFEYANEIGMDEVENKNGYVNTARMQKEYTAKVDGTIEMIKEVGETKKKLEDAMDAVTTQKQAQTDAGREIQQHKDITKAQQETKTAERKRAITDFKNEKEREEAIRKATDKELQGMLKQLNDLLATQGNDPEEYKKTQGRIDEVNAQIKKRQQDAEKEQKKREKIEAKARKEATTKRQVEQLGWVIDKVEGTLSSDADLGTKLNQLGAVANKITKDKSQITDELLEYVKSGLEQLAEAAKNQQAQASKLAAISKQLDATNTALAAAQKQIKNMPH